MDSPHPVHDEQHLVARGHRYRPRSRGSHTTAGASWSAHRPPGHARLERGLPPAGAAHPDPARLAVAPAALRSPAAARARARGSAPRSSGLRVPRRRVGWQDRPPRRAAGWTTRSVSATTPASTGSPPKDMQRGSRVSIVPRFTSGREGGGAGAATPCRQRQTSDCPAAGPAPSRCNTCSSCRSRTRKSAICARRVCRCSVTNCWSRGRSVRLGRPSRSAVRALSLPRGNPSVRARRMNKARCTSRCAYWRYPPTLRRGAGSTPIAS
jgi:hypothetical protein